MMILSIYHNCIFFSLPSNTHLKDSEWLRYDAIKKFEVFCNVTASPSIAPIWASSCVYIWKSYFGIPNHQIHGNLDNIKWEANQMSNTASQLQTNNERHIWSRGNKELIVFYKALHIVICTFQPLFFHCELSWTFKVLLYFRTTQRAQFWKFNIFTNVFYPELRWLTNVTFVWLTLYGLYMVQRIWKKECHKTRP
jgi:hypothetical protein